MSQEMTRQVRTRPCPGRGHGQGVATLSPRRVAEPTASLQNATRLRPPVLDPPPHPLAGSPVLPRVDSQELRRGSCRGRKHKPEAPPLQLKEPIGARRLGARVLPHFYLRSFLLFRVPSLLISRKSQSLGLATPLTYRVLCCPSLVALTPSQPPT